MGRKRQEEPIQITFRVVTPASEMTADQALRAHLGIGLAGYLVQLRQEQDPKN